MLEPLPMIDLLWLVARDAFLSAQFFPLSSNTAFYAAKAFGWYDMTLPSAINALALMFSALVYYGVGRLFSPLLQRFSRYETARQWGQGWGKYLLLLTPTPVGVILAMGAGMLRVNFINYCILILISNSVYYFMLAVVF